MELSDWFIRHFEFVHGRDSALFSEILIYQISLIVEPSTFY